MIIATNIKPGYLRTDDILSEKEKKCAKFELDEQMKNQQKWFISLERDRKR